MPKKGREQGMTVLCVVPALRVVSDAVQGPRGSASRGPWSTLQQAALGRLGTIYDIKYPKTLPSGLYQGLSA